MGPVVGSVTAPPGPTWAELLRHDVIPVMSAYVLLVVMLLRYGGGRSPPVAGRNSSDVSGATTSSKEPPRGRRVTEPRRVDLVRYLVRTALGGYVVFLFIVTLYYFALGGEPGSFLEQALWGGAFLGFVAAIPGFMLIDRAFGRTARPRPGTTALRTGRRPPRSRRAGRPT